MADSISHKANSGRPLLALPPSSSDSLRPKRRWQRESAKSASPRPALSMEQRGKPERIHRSNPPQQVWRNTDAVASVPGLAPETVSAAAGSGLARARAVTVIFVKEAWLGLQAAAHWLSSRLRLSY